MTISQDPPMTREIYRLLEAGISLGLQKAIEQLLCQLSPETRESLLRELRELDLQTPASDVATQPQRVANDTARNTDTNHNTQ